MADRRIPLHEAPRDGNAYVRQSGDWVTIGGGGGLTAVVDDTTPQLGGNLDSNGFNVSLTSGSALVVWDATNTDSVTLSHDGTDFNTAFVTTDDWNVTGLGGADPRLNLEGSITVANPGWYIDRSADNSGITLYGGRWSTAGNANIELYGVSHAQAGKIYYDAAVHTFRDANAGNTSFRITPASSLVEVLGGDAFRIYDSTNTDYAAFSHDGTDFTVTSVSTTDVNFVSQTTFTINSSSATAPDDILQLQGNSNVRFTFRADGVLDWGNVADYGYLSWNTGRAVVGSSGGHDLELDPASGVVRLDGAARLRVYDSLETDYVDQYHNGINYNVIGVNTAQIDIQDIGSLRLWNDTQDSVIESYVSGDFFPYIELQRAAGTTKTNARWTHVVGSTGDYQFSDQTTGVTRMQFFQNGNNAYNVGTNLDHIWQVNGNAVVRIDSSSTGLFVEDGYNFRIFDATNADYVNFSHDGTNFNIVGTNTSRIQFEGTGLLSVDVNSSGADLRVLEGGSLQVFDATNADSVEMSHDGTDFYLSGTNTDWFRLDNFVGGMWVMDGKQIRIADSLDTDYMRLYHDGTHFYMNAVNTNDIVLRDIQEIVYDASAGTAPYNSTYTGIYFLSTGTAAASYYGLHNNFNQSGTGGPTTAYIEMSANGPTYSLYSGFRSHIYATTEDNQQTSFAITGDNGAFMNFWVLGGVPDTSIVEIYDGSHLRILDSTGTDYVDFNHDGTNFNADFTNTTDWDIDGLADVNLLTGTALKIWGTTNVESLIFSVESTYSQISSSNDVYVTGGINFSVLDSLATNKITLSASSTQAFIDNDAGGIRLRPNNGIVDIIRTGQNWLRIWDSTTTDYFQISESGTNAQLSANNNNIQISSGGGIVELTNGQTFRIRDAANTDNIAISHDGVDVNIVGTNTTDINWSGITNMTWNGGSIPYSSGTTGGTGSAGAGNQYVQLTINGTTYKLLHDGTV